MIKNILNIKDDFPIFKNQKKLVYFDSASTTQKPASVINKITMRIKCNWIVLTFCCIATNNIKHIHWNNRFADRIAQALGDANTNPKSSKCSRPNCNSNKIKIRYANTIIIK